MQIGPVKIVTIDKCLECPFYANVFNCCRKCEDAPPIEDATVIPAWCPLPDATAEQERLVERA